MKTFLSCYKTKKHDIPSFKMMPSSFFSLISELSTGPGGSKMKIVLILILQGQGK